MSLITASNSSSSPTLNFVLSSSLQGANINFSGSLTLTSSFPSGALGGVYWGLSTSSITQYNSMTLLGTPVSTSLVEPLIRVLSQSINLSVPSASRVILNTFISESRVSGSLLGLFSSCSITLTGTGC